MEQNKILKMVPSHIGHKIPLLMCILGFPRESLSDKQSNICEAKNIRNVQLAPPVH